MPPSRNDERPAQKYAVPFVLSSVVLFAAGGTLAYITVDRALDFLISWAGDDVNEIFTVNSYISLIGLMIFAFGVGFLLPVLFVFLQLVNVVTPRLLLKSWRYATIGVFVLAAVITPSGDPVTLMKHQLTTEAGRALYALRKQTVEPVFGIIKQVMGLRQFSMRGLDKVAGEWTLATLAWNVKRMNVLRMALS